MKQFILIMCLLFVLSSCAADDNCRETTGGFTFTDDLGRTVTVNSFERVAPLLGSFADIWMLAGGEVAATADDAWDDFKLDIPESAVNLGPTKNMSLELLLSVEPDFIIASTRTAQHMEWKSVFDEAGIPVAYFDVQSFEDYLRLLKICTDITGRSDLYEKNGEALRQRIENIIEIAEERVRENGAPKVLFLRASANWIRAKSSEGTVLGEMLLDLGCVNIADDDDMLLENLSMESIVLKNPDYIFIVQNGDDTEGMKKATEEMFAGNPAWSEVNAVKNGNVIYLDKMLYNVKPNERWAEAYEKLEQIFEK